MVDGMIDIEELKNRVQTARKMGMTLIGMTQECAAELIERLEAAEREAAKYRIMQAGADQRTTCLLHLLGPDCRKGYIHDLEVSEHEARPEVQMLAHVLVSERPGKFALIHLVAYLLDAAIAKGKA